MTRAGSGNFGAGFRDVKLVSVHPYEMIGGHVVIETDDGALLLDTGAPTSVGPAELHISGRVFRLRPCYGYVTPAYLSREIRTRIDGLLGVDVLREFVLCLDPNRQLASFASEVAELPVAVPIDLVAGVPVMEVSVGNKVIRAFFDTGAALSYLSPELTVETPAVGRREDFYPGLGTFETDVFDLETQIGPERLRLTYGHLPHALQRSLMRTSTKGIVGSELLESFVCALSLKDRELRLLRIDR
ncbi:hypothetical protein [Accumulibacter sp.]|uniref:hypothetical protein n=1 Tax=Accumulibacter sp. TaxID=2053492 RepID=UPI0025F942C6|nr:hypothetical protein [Accumulibacter sp.]MCM8596365.1 hypothetical protein [Accumulibacter sp.]MDS4050514.1 hypothetical protein [Accumulibacter sp.]